MIRAVVWAQILFILSCVAYSTYCLFQGDFEKGLLPYPVLILYYLIFSRRKIKKTQPSEGQEPRV
jgi:hypothetical protein